jgi:hypothetical protein
MVARAYNPRTGEVKPVWATQQISNHSRICSERPLSENFSFSFSLSLAPYVESYISSQNCFCNFVKYQVGRSVSRVCLLFH